MLHFVNQGAIAMSKMPYQYRTLLLVTMAVIAVVIEVLLRWGKETTEKKVKVVHNQMYE